MKLGSDYYWSIPPKQRYNVYSEPDDFTIGQVSADLGNLRSDRDGLVTGLEVVWLGRVFEAIGDEL